MKSRIAVAILSISMAVLSLSLGGCSSGEIQTNSTDQPSSVSNLTQPNNSQTDSDISGNNSSVITSNIPNGEPTFLIGLDGKAILTSEITRLENTNKTAETLTEDDLWAEVYCDGFAYCKEPLNIGYDSYKNPELFESYNFLGETPENKNEWKRVNVGDEICGLKVKSAVAHFTVNDWDSYTFPERYLVRSNLQIELEGTVEAEGFLQVYNRSVQYPQNNELVWFYPTSLNLPITPTDYLIDNEEGFKTAFDYHTLYNTSDFATAGEFNDIGFGYLADIGCDMDGIGTGDIVYVRVTLGNIKCTNGAVDASLEKVERISDILEHIEDDNSTGHQMGM